MLIYVLTIAGLVLIFIYKTPRNSVTGNLRFICEKALDSVTVFFIIWLVCIINKVCNKSRIKGYEKNKNTFFYGKKRIELIPIDYNSNNKSRDKKIVI
mgnify:CR=1 FL=1